MKRFLPFSYHPHPHLHSIPIPVTCLLLGQCSKSCQKEDWLTRHKAECKNLKHRLPNVATVRTRLMAQPRNLDDMPPAEVTSVRGYAPCSHTEKESCPCVSNSIPCFDNCEHRGEENPFNNLTLSDGRVIALTNDCMRDHRRVIQKPHTATAQCPLSICMRGTVGHLDGRASR